MQAADPDIPVVGIKISMVRGPVSIPGSAGHGHRLCTVGGPGPRPLHRWGSYPSDVQEVWWFQTPKEGAQDLQTFRQQGTAGLCRSSARRRWDGSEWFLQASPPRTGTRCPKMGPGCRDVALCERQVVGDQAA